LIELDVTLHNTQFLCNSDTDKEKVHELSYHKLLHCYKHVANANVSTVNIWRCCSVTYSWIAEHWTICSQHY